MPRPLPAHFEPVTPGDRGLRSSRVAVLIPCFNEEITIADVVRDFRAALPAAEVYVFDNHSTDRSVERARGEGAHVRLEPRRGKGHVLQAMFRTIDADLYLLVDGDRTYPARAAQALLEPLISGRADMVVGSRLHPGAVSDFSALHRWGNRFFVFVLKRLFGTALTDLLSGYRALNHAAVRQVQLTSGGFQIEAELTIKVIQAGLRIAEVPVNLTTRPEGSRSKLRWPRDGLAILAKMLELRVIR
jgi:glycosyltransferase involved in cell wall biosynthesis